MRQQIVDAPVAQMRRADGIAVAPCRQRTCQQVVKVFRMAAISGSLKIRIPFRYPPRLKAATWSAVKVRGSFTSDG